ncbi:hypothetical protein BDV96DRAFT_595013 [Lophiotrema nucula]|uniref:Stress-response A/B barrel domain-containing protein n=1 Tax=Lophiotrema nucula TaxID=690887 RepID=A0A6A5ZN19_9PLEO|nr:hypothetical protein BDV96DRAFT_595013 [Lophiotrema nucula]
MAIYHIVLFKLKPGVTQTQISTLRTAGAALVGRIPGLRSFKLGPPLASTAFLAQGWELGVHTVFDNEETLLGYVGHEAHKEFQRLREPMTTEILAFDMEFDE